MTTFTPTSVTPMSVFHRLASNRETTCPPVAQVLRQSIGPALQSGSPVDIDLTSLSVNGAGRSDKRHLRQLVLDLRTIAGDTTNNSCLTAFAAAIEAAYAPLWP